MLKAMKQQRYGYICTMHLRETNPLHIWLPAAHALKDRLRAAACAEMPRMVVVAGSGIMDAFEGMTTVCSVEYADLPSMPTTTVAGHQHAFRVIEIGTTLVGVFCGRFHAYEGHSVPTLLAPIAIACGLGSTHVLLTNAAGGLHPLSRVGSVMIITDLLNATPLTIPALPAAQPIRHQPIIDEEWTSGIRHRTAESGIPTTSGTYVQVLGPSFETRAEIGMMRKAGADAIGMSTAIEAHYARTVGMRVAAASMITNTLTDTSSRTVTHEEVIAASNLARHSMRGVLVAAADWVSLCA